MTEGDALEATSTRSVKDDVVEEPEEEVIVESEEDEEEEDDEEDEVDMGEVETRFKRQEERKKRNFGRMNDVQVYKHQVPSTCQTSGQVKWSTANSQQMKNADVGVIVSAVADVC